MKRTMGYANNSVQTEEVVANKYDCGKRIDVDAISISAKAYDEHNQIVTTVLTRNAAIRLYHQLERKLFTP